MRPWWPGASACAFFDQLARAHLAGEWIGSEAAATLVRLEGDLTQQHHDPREVLIAIYVVEIAVTASPEPAVQAVRVQADALLQDQLKLDRKRSLREQVPQVLGAFHFSECAMRWRRATSTAQLVSLPRCCAGLRARRRAVRG